VPVLRRDRIADAEAFAKQLNHGHTFHAWLLRTRSPLIHAAPPGIRSPICSRLAPPLPGRCDRGQLLHRGSKEVFDVRYPRLVLVVAEGRNAPTRRQGEKEENTKPSSVLSARRPQHKASSPPPAQRTRSDIRVVHHQCHSRGEAPLGDNVTSAGSLAASSQGSGTLTPQFAPIPTRQGWDYTHYVTDKAWAAHRRGSVLLGGEHRLQVIRATVISVISYEPTTKTQELLYNELLQHLDTMMGARERRLAAVTASIPPVLWYVESYSARS
jgi:hypothetical protein